jgi:nucleoside 2-deoxyribosyltransferase
MKVIYVAGPFRSASTHMPGQQDSWGIQCNVMRAMGLALEVWRLGHAALCPHANTMFYQNAAKDEVWLDGDLAILAKCDAILMTPDYERSSGARAEKVFAEQRGIPVFLTLDALKDWLSTEAAIEQLGR